VALQFLLPALLGLSAAATEAPAGGELRQALGVLSVRRAPSPKAPIRGMVQRGLSVWVLERQEGPGCEGGWGRLGTEAWLCLTDTAPTAQPPVQLPVLLDFHPPTPEERGSYYRSGQYEALEGEDPLLPYIYGLRGRKGLPPVYRSAEAFAKGQPPIGQADPDRTLWFVGAEPTERGEVLLRSDGTVIPADAILLYPIDRFAGRDLDTDPLPAGRIPAWATATGGTPVYAAPARDAAVGATLPYHAALELDATPADPDGRWWTVPDGLGPGVPGYVEDRGGLRHLTFADPPPDVGEALWLDVDLDEQVLCAWQGGRPRYVTLVSTGKASDRTPTGLYRVHDKTVAWDMVSLPDAEEPYAVERVPWVMHFAPRYALHGVFWHWSFGHVRSHGCVNLAPRDARWIFEHIVPSLPPSWSVVYESPTEPGTLLRVRSGTNPVPDRRVAL